MGIRQDISAAAMAALLAAHPVAQAAEPDEMGVKHVLTLGKFVGLCGSFAQMARFQDTTKLDGGDEFMTRFLLAESARLGMSPQEFMEQCAERTKLYDTWYEIDLDAP